MLVGSVTSSMFSPLYWHMKGAYESSSAMYRFRSITTSARSWPSMYMVFLCLVLRKPRMKSQCLAVVREMDHVSPLEGRWAAPARRPWRSGRWFGMRKVLTHRWKSEALLLGRPLTLALARTNQVQMPRMRSSVLMGMDDGGTV